MKTTILKFKRTLVAAVIALAVLTTGNNAQASSKDPDTSAKAVNVKYLGTDKGQPIFVLDVNNEAGEELTLWLKDVNGETLYTQKVTAKSFIQKIRLATTETEISLSLVVYSSSTKKSQVYEINKVTYTSDDLVVNQVKY